MSTDDLIQLRRDRMLANITSSTLENFDKLMRTCESPIERLFLAEWLSHDLLHNRTTDEQWAAGTRLRDSRIAPNAKVSFTRFLVEEQLSEATAWMWGQYPVAFDNVRFRIDFVVAVQWLAGDADWYAIECDGHDFHERTKDQARSDRSRDRLLMANGWQTVRFTGSEIYAHANGSALELLRIILASPNNPDSVTRGGSGR